MRLRIIRTSGAGTERERIIGNEALAIGRGDDCDWVLPDPERTLSKRHCEVAFQGAVFVLRDTSTNGVFVNDSMEPVGRGKTVVLKHGDSFRAAGFGFRVEVLAAAPTPQTFVPSGPPVSTQAPMRPAFVDPGSAIDGAGFGGDTDPFDAFRPDIHAHDPITDGSSFDSDWGADTTQAGFSGTAFGAFTPSASDGVRSAVIPEDLDLIPLGAPPQDDPWSVSSGFETQSGVNAEQHLATDVSEMAAVMIEALVQLDRQHQAIARHIGLGTDPVSAADGLPPGAGPTLIRHLASMPDGQGRAVLTKISQELVTLADAIAHHLDAQPQSIPPERSSFSTFEDDPFE
jgi:pSer/pThr/pTyr-binding forkhead associated (FHA) protein